MSKMNPVIEVYKGVNVRTTNVVKLVLSPVHFKKILDESDSTGLSIPKLLAYSGKPCDKCKDTCYTVYGDDGEPIRIKKGILHIPESNGISIIKKAKMKLNG